jgi:hypothetical protein
MTGTGTAIIRAACAVSGSFNGLKYLPEIKKGVGIDAL